MLDPRARCNGQFKHRFLEEPGPQILPLCCSDQNSLPLSAFLLTYGGITHLELESPEAQFIRHTRKRKTPAPAVLGPCFFEEQYTTNSIQINSTMRRVTRFLPFY